MADTHQQIAECLDLKGEVCPYTFVTDWAITVEKA